ncbi:RHS repeat-associated core domain-containing protein [Singulisphaera sp. GP187]|uniref:RHS repeat-associated core domain-containing protein n=1 Tax=Singulisphaera sp. GP187 TaxID=1882752 RepID=UPI0009415B1C|nr:RHS repeat-associated core domain-containing protein [Singulisphaera sp. GP187]
MFAYVPLCSPTAGTLRTRYLHGPAVDMLLARTDATGATAWYLADRLGSIRDLANTAGTVIDHVVYDSFGRVTAESNPSAGDRFKFTGRELDAATGLQYHRARYYDAALGRWTQEDPIGFAAGDANLYRYVGNGPTGKVDPSGLADFHLGGQGYVWPWNWTPSWGGVGNTVGAYGQSLGVIGAGGLGGGAGGAISGGVTWGVADTVAGGVVLGPPGAVAGFGIGAESGSSFGGILDGVGGAWGH